MGSSGKVIEFKAPPQEKVASAAPSRRPASRPVRHRPTKRVEPTGSAAYETIAPKKPDPNATGALSKDAIHAAAESTSEDKPKPSSEKPSSSAPAVEAPTRAPRHVIPHFSALHASVEKGPKIPEPAKRASSDEVADEKRRPASLRERIAALQGAGRKATIALVCIIIAAAFLYVPARNYYIARRDAQELAYKLGQTNANNETLRSDVDTLETQEGIEDAARKRGYVKEGETAVSVEGLDDSSTSGSSVTSIIADDQASIPDEPWYVNALDVIFFYKAG